MSKSLYMYIAVFDDSDVGLVHVLGPSPPRLVSQQCTARRGLCPRLTEEGALHKFPP